MWQHNDTQHDNSDKNVIKDMASKCDNTMWQHIVTAQCDNTITLSLQRLKGDKEMWQHKDTQHNKKKGGSIMTLSMTIKNVTT
jgi:hypothetical protein